MPRLQSDKHRGHGLRVSQGGMEVDEASPDTSPRVEYNHNVSDVKEIMTQLAFTPTFAKMKILADSESSLALAESPHTSLDTVIVESPEQESDIRSQISRILDTMDKEDSTVDTLILEPDTPLSTSTPVDVVPNSSAKATSPGVNPKANFWVEEMLSGRKKKMTVKERRK